MAVSRPNQNLHSSEASITVVVAAFVVVAVALYMALPVALNPPALDLRDIWPSGVFALIFYVVGFAAARLSVGRNRAEGSTGASE